MIAMPDTSYESLSGAKAEAVAMQAALANSKMRLFKAGFVPSPTSTKADFEANECDYQGYAEKTLAAWGDPVLAGQGWMTYAPVQTFTWTNASPFAGNVVGGHFIVDSDGVLRSYTVYDPTVPMQGEGMAVVKQPVVVIVAG